MPHVPTWLQAEIADFGKALHLPEFHLNERGAALFRAKDGQSFGLECQEETLFLYRLGEWDGTVETAKELLMEAHPLRQIPGKPRIRVGVFHGRAARVIALPFPEVNRQSLEESLRRLWK